MIAPQVKAGSPLEGELGSCGCGLLVALVGSHKHGGCLILLLALANTRASLVFNWEYLFMRLRRNCMSW